MDVFTYSFLSHADFIPLFWGCMYILKSRNVKLNIYTLKTLLKASQFIYCALWCEQLHFICYSFLSFRQILACRQTWADTVLGNYILNSWGKRGVLYLSDFSLAQWMFYGEKKKDFCLSHKRYWRVKHDWPLLEPSDLSLHWLADSQENTNFHFDFTAGGWWSLISFHPIAFFISPLILSLHFDQSLHLC